MTATDTILVTTSNFFNEEAAIINSCLKENNWRLHIRKPDQSIEKIEELVASIQPEFRSRTSIHYHPELAIKHQLSGVHFSSKQFKEGVDLTQYQPHFKCSTSCHTISEVYESSEMDYVFFGPVYPSISKEGYLPIYNHYQISDFLSGQEQDIYALGGITQENKQSTLNMGFSGVALLGDFWSQKK